MASKLPRTTKIDLELVKRLASIGCTTAEVAAMTKVALRTIVRHCQDEMEDGRQHLRMSIRRKQYELAVTDGDKTMLIWLGKQYLGQTDRQDINANVSAVSFVDIAKRMLAAEGKELDQAESESDDPTVVH